MRWLLVHEEMGVYLGSCFGAGFWSKLDPVKQPSAVTFESEVAALDHALLHNQGTTGFRAVAVVPSDGQYATIADCLAVGLEGWSCD